MMVALKTVALVDAARMARLFAGELARPVKVTRLDDGGTHRWAVLAPNLAALEVFMHCLPYLATELWPHSRGS